MGYITIRKIVDGASWRVRRLVGDKRIDNGLIALAKRKRPMLNATTFCAVVGSGGKTTTKDLIFGVLSETGRGSCSMASLNAFPEVAKMVLRTRRADKFCVIELSEDRPGTLGRSAELVRPKIVVVTVIRDDHLAAFSSKEELFEEFRELLAGLPADSIAVLNADDPSFGVLTEATSARVLSYGSEASADITACDISADWPHRLAFTVQGHDQSVRVTTRLVGKHWVHAVLAAIAGGIAHGMSLEQAAKGVAQIEAFDGRMQPVESSRGIQYIRDDFKAPMWTLPSCLEVLANASTEGRKIVVLGTLSDRGAGAGSTKKYRDIAAQLAALTDIAIFVGPMAHSALSIRKALPKKVIRTFSNIEDAADFFHEAVRPGDLVLLKGTNKQDHLSRMLLAETGPIGCWRNACGIEHFCEHCGFLNRPHSERFRLDEKVLSEATIWFEERAKNQGTLSNHRMIVGLGNRAEKYKGTPHNAGFDVVTALAGKHAMDWVQMPLGQVAEGRIGNKEVVLFKPDFNINNSGQVLGAFAAASDIDLTTCTLVHDELELRYGDIKVRNKGGDGGHRGLATLLDLLQTEQVTRLKIGIRGAAKPSDLTKYVLSRIDENERENYQNGINLAVDRLEQLI